MGFLGDLAKGAFNAVKEKNDRMQDLYDAYSEKPDSMVMNMYRNASSHERKLVFGRILKERGLL